MSEADEGLQLRSGRIVTMATQESEGEQIAENVEELRSRVHELEQKLAMSEQAVNDKDEELQAIREALDNAKSEAATDLTLAKEEAEREMCELERELRETIENLKRQNQGLQGDLEACSLDLRNQEVKFELNRLQGLENLRQTFDREREVYMARIQKLEKELATEKELRLSLTAGSGKGDASSHSGELHSVSVETPKGKRAGVVSGSEHGSVSSVEAGETRVTSLTTVVASKVLEADPSARASGGSRESCGIVGSGKVPGSTGGPPVTVGRDSAGVAAKEHESVVSESAPGKTTSSETGHGVTSPGGVDKSKVLGASPGDSVSAESGDSPKSAVTGGVAESSMPAIVPADSSELAQSMAKFIQAHTDMMAAQTKAMAAQSLPPLVHFSGEGSLVGEESFDRWLEHFEERAAVAGWSEDQKKYRLKMHLDKTAFQTFCMLSKETKQSYSAVVEALRKRFHPVDIEELRGAEFYQIYQKEESVEEIGIKLQSAARKAFPSLIGKEHDRLMKGRFFQSLLPKWQRKLGAPKTDETFEDLFNRARTVEKHDEQYSQSAADKSDNRKKSSSNKAESQSKAGSENSGGGAKESAPQNYQKSVVCFNCEQPGHIARNCWKPRRRSEATGRHGGNPNSNKVLVTVAEMSDSQLEQELADRKLAREEQILADSSSVSTVNVIEGAVGPTLMLELSVEGLQVAAVVDTASNSTIISRSMLHEIKHHLQAQGKPMPRLELPCVPLYGKEGTKGKPLDITAQVSLTFACDGRRVTVPTFIQPESEQKCLIGMNVIPFLGITVHRANGKPLHAIVEHDAQVRLVHSTTIPSMKGRVVEAQLIDSDSFCGSELLFQPEHKVLQCHWAREYILTTVWFLQILQAKFACYPT